MPRPVLTEFAHRGFLAPIPLFPAATLAQLWEAQVAPLQPHGKQRFKTHLLVPELNELVRAPQMLAVVQAALQTEDLLVWSSDWCIKTPHSRGYFSWHQDSTYAGMSSPQHVLTVWLAFSPSTLASGCVRTVPHSHRWGQLPHKTQHDDDNLLSRAQYIHAWDTALDFSAQAQPLELQPGEASLHAFRTVHASGPNTTSQPRIGFAIRYCSVHVQREARVQTRESALLVSGEIPSTCAFDLEAPPQQYNGPAERAQWEKAIARENANYFADNPLRDTYHH